MTNWTDDQLEALLRDTFRDHEDQADPDRARALATTAPDRRRRWPVIVSAAAAVALVVGGTSYVVTRSDGPSTPPAPPLASSPTPPGLGATDEENIAATRAQAAWILHAIPMPDGAKEWNEPPTAVLGEPGLGMCPSDTTLRLTTWWTVPLPGIDFVDWVEAHVPNGLHVDPNESQSGNIVSFAVSGSDTAAFTTPTLAMNYIDRGDRTEVRIDTFISARYGRSTFIPTATSVTIRHTRDSSEAGTETVTTRQLSDPEGVAQVVSLANRLPGVPSGDCVHSCPPGDGGIYTLRFLGAAGAFVVRATEDFCGIGATLRANGSFVEPLLDPDQSFFERLDRLLRRR